jgi:hypothetical protein
MSSILNLQKMATLPAMSVLHRVLAHGLASSGLAAAEPLSITVAHVHTLAPSVVTGKPRLYHFPRFDKLCLPHLSAYRCDVLIAWFHLYCSAPLWYPCVTLAFLQRRPMALY